MKNPNLTNSSNTRPRTRISKRKATDEMNQNVESYKDGNIKNAENDYTTDGPLEKRIKHQICDSDEEEVFIIQSMNEIESLNDKVVNCANLAEKDFEVVRPTPIHPICVVPVQNNDFPSPICHSHSYQVPPSDYATYNPACNNYSQQQQQQQLSSHCDVYNLEQSSHSYSYPFEQQQNATNGITEKQNDHDDYSPQGLSSDISMYLQLSNNGDVLDCDYSSGPYLLPKESGQQNIKNDILTDTISLESIGGHSFTSSSSISTDPNEPTNQSNNIPQTYIINKNEIDYNKMGPQKRKKRGRPSKQTVEENKLIDAQQQQQRQQQQQQQEQLVMSNSVYNAYYQQLLASGMEPQVAANYATYYLHAAMANFMAMHNSSIDASATQPFNNSTSTFIPTALQPSSVPATDYYKQYQYAMTAFYAQHQQQIANIAFERDLCVICGDRSSGYHYGVLSCEGCKGFFRRSVHLNMKYHCNKDNKCIVDRDTRNRCQACRFEKCLKSGMLRENIKNENKRGNHKHQADDVEPVKSHKNSAIKKTLIEKRSEMPIE